MVPLDPNVAQERSPREARARRCSAAPLASVALASVLLAAWCLAAAPARSTPSLDHDPPGEPVSFAALPGFATDDLRSAFRAFRASCAALVDPSAPLRSAQPAPPELKPVCRAATAQAIKPAAIRAFFERHFTPRKVAGDAFFTGYYEPVVRGSLVPTKTFATPLYAKPAGLVSVLPGSKADLDPALTAARRLPDGRLVAMPDRAAIEAGALGREARPLVYVETPADAFFIQVQGSARIRLPGGGLRRLVYAGRNGYPYTSIGKILVARLHIPPREMGMTQLRAWIRDNGQGEGDAGTRLMRENRSFIFFRFDEGLPPGAGPIGGEGLSLTPGRSLAIDHALWPYGLPFYLATSLPDATPFRRLMVGQDTGAAIQGLSRADIFFGTGDEAARQAGAVRQPGTLFVLWPKASSSKPGTGRR